jgi:hypothetical protein
MRYGTVMGSRMSMGQTAVDAWMDLLPRTRAKKVAMIIIGYPPPLEPLKTGGSS